MFFSHMDDSMSTGAQDGISKGRQGLSMHIGPSSLGKDYEFHFIRKERPLECLKRGECCGLVLTFEKLLAARWEGQIGDSKTGEKIISEIQVRYNMNLN